jgi:hypothetical protein
MKELWYGMAVTIALRSRLRHKEEGCTDKGGAMATIVHATEATLHDLGARFGLQLTEDRTFFLEW